MRLLTSIMAAPIDPGYAATAHHRSPTGRRWALAVAAVLVGSLFTVGAVQATRSAPALESERRDLIERVRAQESESDRLRAQLIALESDVDRLRAAALGGSDDARALEAQIDTLAPRAGGTAVRGPGVVLMADDADDAVRDARDVRDRVLDLDLQVMVNGLWWAGAEAIAVNGHRLSARTAIRGAGDAITVDYRSLTRPYRVEAIGDPRTLPARWATSPGAGWWDELVQDREMRLEVTKADELLLPADPGLGLRFARTAR